MWSMADGRWEVTELHGVIREHLGVGKWAVMVGKGLEGGRGWEFSQGGSRSLSTDEDIS